MSDPYDLFPVEERLGWDLAELAAETPGNNGHLPPHGIQFVDWDTFWDVDHSATDWLWPDILARGRGHALYATHGHGKSLFALWVALQLATGPTPVAVIYLDLEMTEADLQERLSDMAAGPNTDLTRLHYALLPELPPLDSPAGAATLDSLLRQIETAHPNHHILVIIDTTSRVIRGEENSADTFRDLHKHTGLALRRHQTTWLRLDHAGKDPTRGQRGSSSKGDDVDIVWRLKPTENGIILTCDKRRMGWVPEKVTYTITDSPLRYTPAARDWPAGTADCANTLSRLNVPLDATYREAADALRRAGAGRRKEVILAAIKWRFETAGTDTRCQQFRAEPLPEPLYPQAREPVSEPQREIAPDQQRNRRGTGRNREHGTTGTGSPPLGGTGSGTTPEPDPPGERF